MAITSSLCMPVAQIVLRNMVIDKVELILPVTGRDDAHFRWIFNAGNYVT
jgi:hypothetical protein